MSCTKYGDVIVCSTDYAYRRSIVRCPVCECQREFVIGYPANPWYSATLMCCGCGDSWSDGELGERPLSRYWRRDAVRKHRELYADATFGPPPKFDPEEWGF